MLSQKILVEFCDIHCKFTIIALDLLPKVKPSLLRRGFALCTGRRFMADSLHQAMRSMSLDDEEPLAFPDSPRFRVFDENAVSILGKLSNPESQPMDKMIEYMPTPWRVHERVRGIALSKDRFQFIFEREEDLLTVLRDRPWSYNGWTLFLERWTLNPPEDFLCTLDIWICIRNIPVNQFTTDTMFRLASEIGEVKEIAYDPKVSQTKEYIRALVRFHIASPAKERRKLKIPSREAVNIEFEYERIHKKCFNCFCITHEKFRCPLLRRGFDKSRLSTNVPKTPVAPPPTTITKEPAPAKLLLEAPPGFPPLFPELSKEDRKMALQYISHVDETERLAQILRVKQSIEESAADSSTRLIKIMSEVDKGKGHVFDYKQATNNFKRPCLKGAKPIASSPALDVASDGESFSNSSIALSQPFQSGQVSTGFSMGLNFKASSSGYLKAGKKERRRPPSWKCKLRASSSQVVTDSKSSDGPTLQDGSTKRKNTDSIQVSQHKSTKTTENTVVSEMKLLPSQ